MSLEPESRIRLTPLQSGMVYHFLREGGGSGVDVVQVEVALPESVDPERLRRAWDEVVAREPVLRMGARWEGASEPHGLIHSTVDLPFERVDLREVPSDERESRYREALHADELRGFDLDRAPLLRVTLFELGDSDARLVWTLHHFLADGWSYALVLEDVFRLYDGWGRGETPVLPERPPFRRFVEWLETRGGEGDRAFWEGMLGSVESPTPLPGERGEGGAGEPQPRQYLHAAFGTEETTRLRDVAATHGATLNTLVQAAWALTLSRYGAGPDVTLGTIRGGRAGTVEGARDMVGLFIQTLPLRISLDAHEELGSLLAELRERWVRMRDHEHVSVSDVQRWSGVASGTLLFRSVLNFQDPFWGEHLTGQGGAWGARRVTLHNRLVYPLTVAVNAGSSLTFRFEFDPGQVEPATMEGLLASLTHVLRSFAESPGRPLSEIEILPEAHRRRVLESGNRAGEAPEETGTVHGVISARAAANPDADALLFGNVRWSHEELEARSNRIAHRLVREGVGIGDRVGVAMERGPEMVAAMLGAMKAGAAYVPIDPHYPPDRVRLMIEDAGLAVLLTQRRLVAERRGTRRLPSVEGTRTLSVDDPGDGWAGESSKAVDRPVAASDLAYVIYTSGSTGRPKGVMVEHRNVLNFFRGMDEAIGDPAGARWLAVTSISFDISVLELLWTLARGAGVAVHPERERVLAVASEGGAGATARPAVPIDFSLFYFSAEGGEGEAAPPPGRSRYRLLLEGCRIADEGDLAAIWTPERHFHEFGGIYPNPSVAAAAVAAVTKRVRIRAGSVVLPLHDTIRVAEEWAVVDNLSDGRVDLSFASGWHDRDFVFAPDRFEDRRELMFREIETLRALWRGESVTRIAPAGEVELRVHPRPVQAELPFWVTAGGSPETFRRAGEVGGCLLTHLLGQSPEQLEEKIRVYREAWRAAGHPGRGHVSLMLHTFIGEDLEEVRRQVRKPFRNYLRTSVGLIKALAEGGGRDLRMAEMSEADMDALLDHAFDRYFETSAMMGTMESNLEMVESLRTRDVDEIACLIDFGVEDEATLESIRKIPELKRRANEGLHPSEGVRVAPEPAEPRADAAVEATDLPASVGEAIHRYGITHLQCTPSMARMILAEGGNGLGALEVLLVGGEAFPATLASELRQQMGGGRILNMYGPTETTIWSSVHALDESDEGGAVVPLGRPILNTDLHVVDDSGRLVPSGVAGELLIGGSGVVRGYLDRPELTAERFIPSPIPEVPGTLYRTGDRVRRRGDGSLQFLGRLDHQVKIRGHRVELGEIESALARHPEVREAVVVPRSDGTDTGQRLVAYLVPEGRYPGDAPLLKHLRGLLPDVMVPSDFVPLDAFPLTPNAKVDRKRLPAPDRRRKGRPDGAEAGDARRTGNDLQRAIASIWSEVLEIEGVGLDDNFFDLGGHSLLTVRVHSLLSDRVASVSITDLFRYPTVRSLADHLAGADGSEGALEEVRDRAKARRDALRDARRRRRSS